MAARGCIVRRCCENSNTSLIADIDYHGLVRLAMCRSWRARHSVNVLIIKGILLRKKEVFQVLAHLYVKVKLSIF